MLRVTRQPLRLTELRKSIQILLRYLSKVDRPGLEEHWSQYMNNLEELQHSSCAECTRLTGIMQTNGSRTSDSSEQKTTKRREYSQAAKELAAHKLQDAQSHGCGPWVLPPALPVDAPIAAPLPGAENASGPLIWVGNSRPSRSRIVDPEFKVGEFVVVKGTTDEPFWVGQLTRVRRGGNNDGKDFQVHWHVSSADGAWKAEGPYKPNYMKNSRGRTVKHTDWLPFDTTVAVTSMKLPANGILPAESQRLITACSGVEYEFG